MKKLKLTYACLLFLAANSLFGQHNNEKLLKSDLKPDSLRDRLLICTQISNYPNHIYAQIVLSILATKDTTKGSILKDTLSAPKIDSVQFQKLVNQSLMHAASGDAEAELEDLTLLVEQNPSIAQAWSSKGSFFLKTRDYDSAVQYFTKAIVLNPKEHQNYINRGLSYSYLGEIEKELADYTKAIDITPSFMAYYNRGRCYLKDRELEKALADNDKVIELAPDYTPAYLNRGNALFKLERYQEAFDCYKKGLTLKPEEDIKNKLEAQLKKVKAFLKK